MSKEYGKLYSKVLGAAASDSMNMDKHADVLLLPTIILRKGKWDPEKIKKMNLNEQNRLIKARMILYQSGPAGRRELWREVLDNEVIEAAQEVLQDKSEPQKMQKSNGRWSYIEGSKKFAGGRRC
jgi:hypothetical protein